MHEKDDCTLADEDNCTEELDDAERRLIYITNLDEDMLRGLEGTGEGIPLLYRNKDHDPPYRCCPHSESLATWRRSVDTIALLALPSGLLLSSSFVWLNMRMELYEPSAIMNKVIQHLLSRHHADSCRL